MARAIKKTEPTRSVKEYTCAKCGSRKWACLSIDGGKNWYCFGHEPTADEKWSKRADERILQDERERRDKEAMVDSQGRNYRIVLTGHMFYLWQVIFKYIWRWPFKEKPIEDLKKAEFYLKKLIKALEKTNYVQK